MYTLYGFPTQNTLKTLYVLEELKSNYEFKPVNLMKGEHKSGPVSELNPAQKVPVLEHNGQGVFESGTICRYIAQAENSNLYPQELNQKYKVEQWMDFMTNHLGRHISTLAYENIIKKMVGAGDPDPNKCDEAKKYAEQYLKVVEQNFSNQNYMSGNDLTISDLFSYAYLDQLQDLNYNLDQYPKVQAWLNNMNQKESVIQVKKKFVNQA